MSRFVALSFVSVFMCAACSSEEEGDDEGDTQAGSESETDTAGDTTGDSETDTGPSCGAAAGVCCAESEPCTATEDCCNPETFTCYLVGATDVCVDLAAMCTSCVTNCEGQGVPPETCEMSCAVWCDAMP